MRRSIRFGLLISALTMVMTAGCEDATPVPTTPSTPVLVTESFDGTLATNGATTFPFTVSSSGAVTATLATVSDAAIAVGLSIGTWNGVACQVVIARDGAFAGDQVIGQASRIGTLCARVYDVGNVVAPVTFTITVQHP